jgi:hypothetical protein
MQAKLLKARINIYKKREAPDSPYEQPKEKKNPKCINAKMHNC